MTDSISHNLERKVYAVTVAQQHLFKRIFSRQLAEFETLWEQYGIHELQKALEHQIVHFGYPKMHLVSHMSESIRRMGLGDNFTTDILELLHISNVKDGYRSSNKVNYTGQIVKSNDCRSSLDYMEETLHYLALQGWNDVDSAKVRNDLRVAFVLIGQSSLLTTRLSISYQLLTNDEVQGEHTDHVLTKDSLSQYSAQYCQI